MRKPHRGWENKCVELRKGTFLIHTYWTHPSRDRLPSWIKQLPSGRQSWGSSPISRRGRKWDSESRGSVCSRIRSNPKGLFTDWVATRRSSSSDIMSLPMLQGQWCPWLPAGSCTSTCILGSTCHLGSSTCLGWESVAALQHSEMREQSQHIYPMQLIWKHFSHERVTMSIVCYQMEPTCFQCTP